MLTAARPHQGVEVLPGVHQAVHALGVPVVEEKFVFVEQSKGFLDRTDGGVDTNLLLPDLKQNTVRRWMSDGDRSPTKSLKFNYKY